MLYIFVANFSDFPTVKNFVNWLRFDEIIVTVGWCIFETQCMMPLIVFIVDWKSWHGNPVQFGELSNKNSDMCAFLAQLAEVIVFTGQKLCVSVLSERQI